MSDTGKIGVIGKRGEILIFKAAGFTAYEAENVPEAAEKLTAAAEECAIIFLAPEYAAALTEEISRYEDALTPAIIALPEKGGGVGMAMLRQNVRRAVGADILFRGED